ncbi:PilN domain-containing protein [Streptococcus sp. 20-1249]|uniref:PilN domain-containing protein n=1 Tax=Streptococcus hepaticus TaxID=3349163 RepID=UPI0029880010
MMMRDLNFFATYHVPPAKTSTVRLAAITGSILALAGVLLGVFYYYSSNSNYETEINKLHMLLEAPEMTQQLEEIEKLQVDKATVTNDQTIFKNLEGDFKRTHKVNRAFMDFVQNRVTRNLVFDELSISDDKVSIVGLSTERLSIAKFEEELRKTDKFNHILVSTIENVDGGGAAIGVAENDPFKDVYKFTIEIETKDVDFSEKK